MSSENKTLKYRQAIHSDLSEIKELLISYELPASDCDVHISNFIVIENSNKILGVGGFEVCSNFGLVRSFAVKEDCKGQGIAEKIFSLVKTKAINSEISKFYLLTTTASKYFERFGFSVCDRDNVPDSVKATKQFNELCPATAIAMVLDLCTQ